MKATITTAVTFLKSHIVGIILVGIFCSVIGSFVYSWIQPSPAIQMAATQNNDFKQIAELNRNDRDFPTLRVANVTLNPGTDPKTLDSMWSTKVRGDIGHIISFDVHYHNNSEVVAKNVQLRVGFEQCLQIERTCITVKAEISGSNFAPVHGEATIEVPPNSYILATPIVTWRPHQTQIGARALPRDQTGKEIYTASGLALEDIEPGYSNQGGVIGRVIVLAGKPPAFLQE